MTASKEESEQQTKRKVKLRDTVPFANGKFDPKLPEWNVSQKKYITQQLAKFDYFKKRPHLYPCNNFDALVVKTADFLNRKKGDFCWSMDWDDVFMSLLIYNGFLTIATEIQSDLYVMLPKLHEERCVLDLDPKSDGNHLPLPVSKSTKKKSRHYRLTVDQAFEAVFQGCIDRHGLNWLYPPMQFVIYSLFKNRGNPKFNGVTAHSIEIWNEDDELVAGELGTCVGSIYTSLTGFYLESSTGSIQLMALGHLLQKCGFLLWDLGMFIEYKSSLGAGSLPRKQFLALYRKLRDTKGTFLECTEKRNCREIVNEVINQKQGRMDEDGDEKMQNEIDNVEKPKSKKEMKRLAKLERRRMAKQRAKEEREKKMKHAAESKRDDVKHKKQNVDFDDIKDIPPQSVDENEKGGDQIIYKRPKEDVAVAKE